MSDPIFDAFRYLPETEFIIDDESSNSSNSSDNSNSQDRMEETVGENEVGVRDVPEGRLEERLDDEIITNIAVDLATLAPEPIPARQKFCALTYAPHLETRTVYVIVSGCFDTFSEADRFSAMLHARDPRWNRSVGETGRPLPIPIDRRLFTDNPIARGLTVPVVPFNIISENLAFSDTTSNTTSEVLAIASEPTSASETSSVSETSSASETSEEVSETFEKAVEIASEAASETVPEASEKVAEASEKVAEASEKVAKASEASEEVASEVSEVSDTSVFSDSSTKCVTCISKDRNALFMPCRHLAFCLECAKIHTSQSNLCPICRTPIKEVMNIFL